MFIGTVLEVDLGIVSEFDICKNFESYDIQFNELTDGGGDFISIVDEGARIQIAPREPQHLGSFQC